MNPINKHSSINKDIDTNSASESKKAKFLGRKVEISDNTDNIIKSSLDTSTYDTNKSKKLLHEVMGENLIKLINNYKINHTSLESRIIAVKKPEPNFLVGKIRSAREFIINKGSQLFSALTGTIHKVRCSAIGAGGSINFKFSQSKGRWQGKMSTDRDTSTGLCYSLTANWIKHKSKNENVFHEIYNGKSKGKINPEVFEYIRALQEVPHHSKSQDEYLIEFLKTNNLTLFPENNVTYQNDNNNTKQPKGTPNYESENPHQENICFPELLAKAIVENDNETDPVFKYISFDSKADKKGMSHSHAVGVMLKNKSVCFFDPNYGEFEFPDKESFCLWFEKKFWKLSFYSQSYFGLRTPMNNSFIVKTIL